MKKAFLISPVTNSDGGKTLLETVAFLESDDWILHWPVRDTRQIDGEGGYNIMVENMKAMKEAELVFVWWDEESKGSLFDLGMALALDKRVICVNPPESTKGKSFQNILLAMEKRSGF